MIRVSFRLTLLSLLLASKPTEAPSAASPQAQESGQVLFEQRCASCHAAQPGAEEEWGPNLYGVLDRPVGSAVDYRYGSYLQSENAAGALWTEESLGAWLADSKAVAKAAGRRTKMPEQDVSEAELLRLTAYLATLGDALVAAQ
jgi:cytochrome c